MLKHTIKCLFLVSLAFFAVSCRQEAAKPTNVNLERAQATLDSLYSHYSADNTGLLRETYPFNDRYSATYLASAEQANVPNAYSYLWPFSGTFSAVNVLLETSGDNKYKDLLDSKVLTGLEKYFDTTRTPYAYSSYISDAPRSDRFYDDNVWLGIDFTDIYMLTKEEAYLKKAKLIWDFVISGSDDKLGGGIYWCEQKKESKNTCSNAPGAVFAFKLFKATNDSTYFFQGKNLYQWTKEHLQDSTDYLYFDNVKLNGSVGKEKYAYNSGQMMQAAALLYNLTNDKQYLEDAQNIARSAYSYFFEDFKDEKGEQFKLLKKGDVWFTAVMLRGFTELYEIDKNPLYLNAFKKNLDYAWNHSRDEKGLFNKDLSGRTKDESKWLLTQAAMVEMYARLATTK
ncbi:glycosyl hydrolase family 76 [Dysgonomonas alginatilytica]|uniref:Glycosyl hydrolase family 76 n=1 Tax=Dysgonomonas alginatilytica TaxID=1605892 RepID=A0A2V3PLX3_9BACT|nr:glycoside hydrolase family 76 protein [Dysgonomonas alginatilytica]PXV61037.1 glycosyl hydrolase family 76 [Dysgonomonas alginatilytica]